MKLVSVLMSVMLWVGACGGSAPGSSTTTSEVVDTSTTTTVTPITTTTTTMTASTISTTSLPPSTTTTVSDGLLAPEDPECTVVMAASWFTSEFGSLVAFNESDEAKGELVAALLILGLSDQEVSTALSIPSEDSIGTWLFGLLERTILWDPTGDGGPDLGYLLVCAAFPGQTVTPFAESPAGMFTELYAGRYGLPGQILLDPDAAPFGDGTWRVGTDIQPGTYGTDGGSTCYWAFLRGFPGTDSEDIIFNNYGGGAQVVTILPTYAGFLSDNCGTWVPL